MPGKGLLGGPGSRSVDGTRQWIALFTVLFSVVGIVVVAIVALVSANSATRPDTARLIFTSMLPLFGTWVGTVLAFYFVRENLAAATESTLRLSGAFSSSDLVTKAMIPLAGIEAAQLESGDDPDAVKLYDLYAQMQRSGRKRIPILLETQVVRYVVHESTITAYAVSTKTEPTDAAAFAFTVGDLLKSPVGASITAIAFVAPTATLAAARASMAAIPGANDVFVTATGQATEPVVGWLTNTMLAGLQ
jgi:hypothetical protein